MSTTSKKWLEGLHPSFLEESTFFLPYACVLVLSPGLPLSPVTVLPCQLGVDSDRAPCPAPPPCVCHLPISDISLFLPPKSRQAKRALATYPHQSASKSYTSWFRSLHTCTIVFVCLSCMPPHLVPCSLTSQLFFYAIPHPTVPLLGSVGGFSHCFWVSLGLPCEGTTPLSSPHTLL